MHAVFIMSVKLLNVTFSIDLH